MPIYEFRCKDCTENFHSLRRLDRIDETTCPKCSSGRVSRLLSVTASHSSDADSSPASTSGQCGIPSSGCMANPHACGCRMNN